MHKRFQSIITFFPPPGNPMRIIIVPIFYLDIEEDAPTNSFDIESKLHFRLTTPAANINMIYYWRD